MSTICIRLKQSSVSVHTAAGSHSSWRTTCGENRYRFRVTAPKHTRIHTAGGRRAVQRMWAGSTQGETGCDVTCQRCPYQGGKAATDAHQTEWVDQLVESEQVHQYHTGQRDESGCNSAHTPLRKRFRKRRPRRPATAGTIHLCYIATCPIYWSRIRDGMTHNILLD